MAFLSGSVVGIAILAREGAAARKKAVPFGVFLALGGIVGVLAGPELVDLYRTISSNSRRASGWCPANLDISSSALSVSSGRPIPLCVRP